MCKASTRPIIFAIQLNNVNKRLTSLRAVGFVSRVHIRGKINIEISEYGFWGKTDFSDTVEIL